MQFLEVQSLDVISINLWSVLISIANLLVMFFILKYFLYKPLQKVLAQRKAAVDRVYSDADEAKAAAEADRLAWAEKMEGAAEEADRIVKQAEGNAELRSETLLADAQKKADGILRRAENEAELERRKAAEGIRKEIVDVSAVLAEKMLGREIRPEDHKALIDSFIGEVGDGNGGTE